MNILFVCTGNSCRSPMAKGLAHKILNEHELYSAGVRPEKAVSQYTVKVMSEIYPEIRHHIPAPLSEFNHLHFDYVICFGQTALRHSSEMFSKKSTEIISYDVADPWNAKGSEEEIEIIYTNTRDQIRELLIEFSKFLSDKKLINNIISTKIFNLKS